MVSTIISGGTDEQRERYAQTLCDKYAIDRFERIVYGKESEEKESTEERFGIALIRTLKKQAILKPLHGKQKALIILEAGRLSHPAQNALLKLLEEPPEQTLIIITAEEKEQLLPTICSRCHSIYLAAVAIQLSEKDREVIDPLLGLGERASLGNRLEIAEKTAKDNPVLFIKKLVLAAHEAIMVTEKQDLIQLVSLARTLTLAQKTYQVLSTTNTNPRLALENLFLSIS